MTRKKNLKLLRSTQGDLETVANFLISRRALRLKAKQLKFDQKIAKKLEKQGRKEKKWNKKVEKKMEKKERKEKKFGRRNGDRNSNSNDDGVSFVSLKTKESWPSGVARLYLDGNNMLYVLSPIRSLVLKGKAKEAEAVLEALARKFADAMNLEHCTLVFDDTNKNVQEDRFVVCSARPSFATSDDALVDWCKGIDKPSLFITSDRELLKRLKECGTHVNIGKPKEWFRFVARVLSDKEVEDLDAWMAQWINDEMKMDIVASITKEIQNKLVV